MVEMIVSCRCEDSRQFIEAAFKIAFPGRTLPPIINSRGVYEPYRLPDEKQHQMALALFKSKDKYAYYFAPDQVFDLFDGVRIA